MFVTKTGCEIYIACEKPEIEDYESRYQNECFGRWLPPRVRFTIAHEIGHTLLYGSVKNSKPKSRIAVDHHRTLESLEDLCDGVAGRILMPTDIIRLKAQQSDFYNPDILRGIAQEAKVSASAVVRRIGEMGGLLSDMGAFAYAKGTDHKREIIAFSTHSSLSPIFANARPGQLLSTFVQHTTKGFILNGGNCYVEVVEFPEQPEWARYFEFRCETQASKGDHLGFFVTARLVNQADPTKHLC
jgi:hypothetical protein